MSNTADGEEGKALDVTAGPVSVRTKGYRLMDIAWLASVSGIIYLCIMVGAHDANASKDLASIANAMKESNKEVADAIREQSRDSGAVLKELARATREQNCLLGIQQEIRRQNAEFCKRISQ